MPGLARSRIPRRRAAFAEAYRLLELRIGALVELPLDRLDADEARRTLCEIGTCGLAPIML